MMRINNAKNYRAPRYTQNGLTSDRVFWNKFTPNLFFQRKQFLQSSWSSEKDSNWNDIAILVGSLVYFPLPAHQVARTGKEEHNHASGGDNEARLDSLARSILVIMERI